MRKRKLLILALIGAMAFTPVAGALPGGLIASVEAAEAKDALGYYKQEKPEKTAYWEFKLNDNAGDYIGKIQRVTYDGTVLEDENENDDPLVDVYGYTKSSRLHYIKVNAMKIHGDGKLVIQADGYRDVTITLKFDRDKSLESATYTGWRQCDSGGPEGKEIHDGCVQLELRRNAGNARCDLTEVCTCRGKDE